MEQQRSRKSWWTFRVAGAGRSGTNWIRRLLPPSERSRRQPQCRTLVRRSRRSHGFRVFGVRNRHCDATDEAWNYPNNSTRFMWNWLILHAISRQFQNRPRRLSLARWIRQEHDRRRLASGHARLSIQPNRWLNDQAPQRRHCWVTRTESPG